MSWVLPPPWGCLSVLRIVDAGHGKRGGSIRRGEIAYSHLMGFECLLLMCFVSFSYDFSLASSVMGSFLPLSREGVWGFSAIG